MTATWSKWASTKSCISMNARRGRAPRSKPRMVNPKRLETSMPGLAAHGGQLRLDLHAEIPLRIRRSLVLAILARRDRLFCRLEGFAQGLRPRQRIAIEGLAEIGEIAVIGTAEGRSILGRSGNDDGLRIAQGVDEAAGITRGNQDDAPLNSRLAQPPLEILGREAGERKP